MGLVVKIMAMVLAVFMLSGFTDRSLDRVTVMRVKDRALIGFTRMIAELQQSKVIVFGENHDRPFDHHLELKIISKLREKRVPLAVALEMFSAERQQTLDSWVAGELGV